MPDDDCCWVILTWWHGKDPSQYRGFRPVPHLPRIHPTRDANRAARLKEEARQKKSVESIQSKPVCKPVHKPDQSPNPEEILQHLHLSLKEKEPVAQSKQTPTPHEFLQYLRMYMTEKELLAADLSFNQTYNILSELNAGAIPNTSPGGQSSHSDNATEQLSMTCDKVIAVHHFMLQEIRKFVEEFKSSPGVCYDFESARLCTGVATCVKLEDEFQITKAVLDRATAQHQRKLKRVHLFKHITEEINVLLSEFDEP